MKSEDPWNIVQEDEMEGVGEMSISEYSFSSEESAESFMDLGASIRRPFDINMLKESIETGSRILEHVANKNVVLVIGKTGAGKSTFIQGIAGKELHETVHVTTCDGEAVEKSVYDAKQALPEFMIGHAKSSQTKAFCSFVPSKQDGKEETVYIDTPGFEDTHHEEIDIATSVMLSHIAKKCKSLRFVVLINYISLLEDRGGAARSILRFTRAFVKDFSKDKTGFMFLFTHTNEISGVSDDFASSKKALLEEILRLRADSDSSDKDLLSLLDFLKKSLQKGYPFADVLHPLESNFEALQSLIEYKLSRIKSPTIAESCGLTSTSRNRLTGEVTTIVLHSRRHLQSDPPNVQAVQDNHEMLQYLSSEINFTEVKKATHESAALIDRFVQHSKRSIEDKMTKGGVNDEMFAAVSANYVREVLSWLNVLGAQNLSERLFERIGKTVFACHGSLKFCTGTIGPSDMRTLHKLSCWCSAFPQYAHHYTAALEDLKSAIGNATEAIAQFRCDDEVDSEAISASIKSICLLNSILRSMDPFMNHDLDIDNIRNAREHALTVTRQLLFSLKEEDSSELAAVVLEEKSLENLSARIGVLEAIRVGLSTEKDFAELASIAGQLLANLQGSVSIQFEALCDEVKKNSIDQVREPLQQLRAVLHRCYGIAALDFGEMHRNLQTLLGIVEEKFRSALESLLRVGLPLDSTECVLKGHEAGLALNEFEQHIWFDEFLPEGLSIIAETCKTVRDANERSCKSIRKEIVHHLDMKKLKTTSLNELQKACRFKSIATLKQAQVAYDRFVEIEQFAATTNNETMLEDCNAVRSMIVTRAGRAMNAMDDLTKTSTLDFEEKEKTATIFARLNSHLEEIQLLELFTKDQECCDRLKSTRELLRANGNAFAKDIEHTFRSGNDFETMAIVLLVLSELHNGDNRFIKSLLPSLVDLIAQARHAVMKSVEAVQTVISGTSDWDKINRQTAVLNGALCLDCFLDGDVAIQLKTLKGFREGKEIRVDSRIDEMIAAEYYVGIGELLSPLANSDDQLKKQKFRRYIALIEAALKKRSGKSFDYLPAGLPSIEITSTIVQHLDKLNEAKQELFKNTKPGSFPSELRNLKQSITKDADKLKSKLNRKLRESLDQSTRDLDNLRIERLAADRKAVMEFVAVAEKHVSAFNRNLLEKLHGRHDNILSSIPKLVSQFFDSWFKDGKDLVKLLRSLKCASVSGNPKTADIAELYNKTKDDLNDRLRDEISKIETIVSEHKCYGDGISVLRSFQHCSDSGLQEHIDDQIIFKIEELMDVWHTDSSAIFNQSKEEHEGAHLEVAATLDRLDPSTLNFLAKKVKKWYCGEEYNSLKTYTEKLCRKINDRGMAAMQSRNLVAVDECLSKLILWNVAVGKHVKTIARNIEILQNCVRKIFLDVCEELKSVAQGTSTLDHKSLFDEFRQLILEVPSILQMDDCCRAFALTNQLFCEKLEGVVAKVKDALQLKQSYDFLEIKVIVEDARSFGDFMADRYAVLFEEVKENKGAAEDTCLKRIAEICHEHFRDGRDFGNIRHYIALGVMPSASQQDIKRAYHVLMKRFHPDSMMATKDDHRNEEKCKRFNAAWEALNDEQRLSTVSEGKPFARLIQGLRDCLLEVVRRNLKNQQYEGVAQLLGRLYAIRELEDLVSPPLDSKHIEESVNNLVRSHVERLRVSVTSHWSVRQFKELQEDIDDLKSMENHFQSHSAVFQQSWTDGIIKLVESEVQVLGNEACLCLKSEQNAKEWFEEFRRLFLRMGNVLVELPLFKAFTKATMSSVLQVCLDEKWGYGYVFELGLSLRRKGDDDNPDEDRVAQMLLSEFTHFKEVMTMVWNEETTRKPAEDTVQDIRGYIQNQSQPDLRDEVDIELDELLGHYRCFDTTYKVLLGEFLPAGADINDLVQKTTQLAEQMKPLSCAKGWDEKVKKSIPELLAGIFALFTVLKSGDAYNRLESSAGTSEEFGDKLLMKPHNIQVLTLLCMFGCGRPSHDSLESHLMQIRTGEGKSMILGAAATFLGLLGFGVRCVCYSEYLSARDYGLFEDVFRRFQIHEDIVYSKITTLSEDTTAAKGDIRYLTESLLRGKLPRSSQTLEGLARIQVGGGRTDVYERQVSQATPRGEGIKLIGLSQNSKIAGPHSAIGTDAGDMLQQQWSEEQPESVSSQASTEPTVMSSSERTVQQQQTGEKQLETAAGQPSAKPIVPMTGLGLQLQKREQQLGAHQPMAKPVVAPTFVRKVKEEILLVDEVDVFFGQGFYGQTYNQVAQLREPEVAELLNIIWASHCSQKKLRLSDLKISAPYHRLLQKMNGFEFLLDNEIFLMLKHVSRIDDEPYHLDEIEQRIGYKVMDTISYDVTYGYRTVFAYLREYDRGNINDQTLLRVLTMPISCGQFSYADISPTRILGVSGTLDVMTRYEKEVLTRYGVSTYLYVPSVYGKSNFSFDQGGEGLAVVTSKSDFYHKICEEIKNVTDEKRAVIVFFKDLVSVKDFESSPFYQKLGRQKKILSEDMISADKDFVISKAATAKQITICPAVFGRGTDFFCKDAKVEKSGGVHVIQTFLSEQRSEEIQIQGRTSRQGKKGSYNLILLEGDLVQTFGIKDGEKDTIPKSDWYKWLCDARDSHCDEHSKKVEMNLAAATKKDKNTHAYFDALLAAQQSRAKSLFKEIYLAMKRPLPSTVILDMAFVIDTTGSMHRFSQDLPSMLIKLFQGQDSISAKLKVKFPELSFKLRVGVLGFRDIDDIAQQFAEKVWSDGSHFTEDMASMSSWIQTLTSASSGGHDLAEDTLGAIHRCTAWSEGGDWEGTIKCLLVLTDAPAHGFAPTEFAQIQNGDSYSVRHPKGLTVESVVDDVMAKNIDLFFCSLNPCATEKTERELSDVYQNHAANVDEKRVACIPMVKSNQSMGSVASTFSSKHIIFILDESGSMQHDWPGVVQAYNKYVVRRLQSQSTLDLVSVVQFESNARLTVDCEPIMSVPNNLGFGSGGTCFSPAATLGSQAAQNSPASHVPVVVFMSDGGTDPSDSAQASQTLSQLNSIVLQRYSNDLELHVIAFGGGADTTQLSDIARASKIGRLHASANSNALSQIFVSIAGGEDVTSMVESQIGKRISDAVASKLSAEYMG